MGQNNIQIINFIYKYTFILYCRGENYADYNKVGQGNSKTIENEKC